VPPRVTTTKKPNGAEAGNPSSMPGCPMTMDAVPSSVMVVVSFE
jgi:hypothetical protein